MLLLLLPVPSPPSASSLPPIPIHPPNPPPNPLTHPQETDDQYLELDAQHQRDDGCTAVTAVLIGRRLVVAHVGDSRAVLSVGGGAQALSRDHKPNRADERGRIEGAGGAVVWAGTWRVGGVLAVSRSFGNRMMKQVGCKHTGAGPGAGLFWAAWHSAGRGALAGICIALAAPLSLPSALSSASTLPTALQFIIPHPEIWCVCAGSIQRRGGCPAPYCLQPAAGCRLPRFPRSPALHAATHRTARLPPCPACLSASLLHREDTITPGGWAGRRCSNE